MRNIPNKNLKKNITSSVIPLTENIPERYTFNDTAVEPVVSDTGFQIYEEENIQVTNNSLIINNFEFQKNDILLYIPKDSFDTKYTVLDIKEWSMKKYLIINIPDIYRFKAYINDILVDKDNNSGKDIIIIIYLEKIQKKNVLIRITKLFKNNKITETLALIFVIFVILILILLYNYKYIYKP